MTKTNSTNLETRNRNASHINSYREGGVSEFDDTTAGPGKTTRCLRILFAAVRVITAQNTMRTPGYFIRVRFQPASFLAIVFLLLAGGGLSLAQDLAPKPICNFTILPSDMPPEVVNSDPPLIEIANVPIQVAFECAKTQDSPVATVSISLKANLPIQTGPLFVMSAFAPKGVNQFIGKNETDNTVVFQGIPIDPPVQVGSTRIIRITNIRANVANPAVLNGGIQFTVASPVLQFVNPTIFMPVRKASFGEPGSFAAGLLGSRPRVEAFLGPEYFRDRESKQNFFGSDASVAVNLNGYLGLCLEVPYLKSGKPNLDSTLVPILAGPQFNYRKEPLNFFGQALFGAVHSSNTFTLGSTTVTNTSNAFGMKVGGGFDWYFAQSFGLRNQVYYDMTRFGGNTQNNYSYATGMVFRFGGRSESAPTAGAPNHGQGTPGGRPVIGQDSEFNKRYIEQLRESAKFWRDQAEKARKWAQDAKDPKTRGQWEREAQWDDSNARQREALADHAEGKK